MNYFSLQQHLELTDALVRPFAAFKSAAAV
jgi:hypothetical protein